MARPRKSPHLKNQPITISLPPAMIANLDELLSYGANRSQWIQTAVAMRLSTPHASKKELIEHMALFPVEIDTPHQLAARVVYLLQNNPDSIGQNVKNMLKEAL